MLAVEGLIKRSLGGLLFIFFFQAEDGIRDLTVTGVQTCALPIWSRCRGPLLVTTAGLPLAHCWRRRLRTRPPEPDCRSASRRHTWCPGRPRRGTRDRKSVV